MKKLSMIVHESLQQALADFLRSQNLNSFMFTHIEEHSAQVERDVFLSARDKVVGYVPQVRVELILSEEDLVSLLKNIKKSESAFIGKVLYWVSDICDYGQL